MLLAVHHTNMAACECAKAGALFQLTMQQTWGSAHRLLIRAFCMWRLTQLPCQVCTASAGAATWLACWLCLWLRPQAPIDFNQYLGIQRAGIACLQLPQQRVREYAAVWRQRAAALVPVLRRFGWKLPEPKACEYPQSPFWRKRHSHKEYPAGFCARRWRQ